MKRVILFAGLVTLLSCASFHSTHKPLTPYQYDVYKFLRGSPCQKEKIEWAYRQLKSYKGCAECALYYFRCRSVPEWRTYLKPRRR